MIVIKTQNELQAYLKHHDKIGFVPTMGALHQGHIGLIQRSMAENDITGCSIFVNPTQFNKQADFDKYPVTLEKDLELLLEVKCDFLFLPSVKEMYPEGISSTPTYDLGYLDTVLEGEHRPGHFNGVCNIVHKLLGAVMPNNLYMGEKDFQQCMVVKRLLEITSLPVNLIICPTLRADDGLAMSSRNMRLSDHARRKANTIYHCLQYIKENQGHASFVSLRNDCLEKLASNEFQTEYLILACADSLQILGDFEAGKKMVVLIASVLEGVRLIDNMRL